MIIIYFINLFNNVLVWLNSVLPNASVLPWGIDATMVSGIGYLRFFTAYFPPLGTLLSAFALYLIFILGIKLIRLFPIIRNILD